MWVCICENFMSFCEFMEVSICTFMGRAMNWDGPPPDLSPGTDPKVLLRFQKVLAQITLGPPTHRRFVVCASPPCHKEEKRSCLHCAALLFLFSATEETLLHSLNGSATGGRCRVQAGNTSPGGPMESALKKPVSSAVLSSNTVPKGREQDGGTGRESIHNKKMWITK